MIFLPLARVLLLIPDAWTRWTYQGREYRRFGGDIYRRTRTGAWTTKMEPTCR